MSVSKTPPPVFSRCLVLACGALVMCGWAGPSTSFAACGDGLLESPAEQCDDGNDEAGDCCAADCQYKPAESPCGLNDLCLKAGEATCDGQGECALPNYVFCFGRTHADLLDPGAPDAQSLKMRGRAGQESENIGDPSAGTQYALCIYNFHDSATQTVDYKLLLPVGAGWQADGDGFVYRRPEGATTPLLSARLSMRPWTRYEFGSVFRSRVRLSARGSGLALPGPIDSSRYFDVAAGISTVCLVNDLGFMTGVSTWAGTAKNRSLLNNPEHVHWAPPQLRD